MTSNEPDFISQTGEAKTAEDRKAWISTRSSEAVEQGAVLCRASMHEDIPDLLLFEAWKVRPTDQGEPRWQLTNQHHANHRGGENGSN